MVIDMLNNAHDLPTCVTVSGQCLHAAGVAYAVKYRQQIKAVVTCCGDGATSKGDFYEAFNLAGAWHLPWFVSLPTINGPSQFLIKNKRPRKHSHKKASLRVSLLCRSMVMMSLPSAKQPRPLSIMPAQVQGATLIEAVSYRLTDHTTADDANRYRPKEQVKQAWKEEPIARLGYYLGSARTMVA